MIHKIDPVPGDVINKKYNRFFPLPLRCLIVGTSGCGKTTLLFNLILYTFSSFVHIYKISRTKRLSKLENTY